jgi:YVTN family beta-propeller protein
MIKTVLFTDIVGSTELASEVGDRQWRQVLAMHHAFIRGLLKRHGGREVDTAGDGFFATFDQPLRAIRCASDIVDGLWAKGLRIRAGAHIGQVEATGSGAKVGGVAVHIGSRVASLAAPGEVLVSGTLKDLVTGSEVEFADRGEHALKGVPGTWHLFAVARELAPEGIPASPAPTLVEQGAAARPRLRRGVLILMGLGLAGLLGSLALVAFRPGVTPPPETVGRLDAATNQFVAAVPVGRQPGGLAAGSGSLWVLNVDDQTISRIDPRSNRVIATRAVGGTPTAIAFGSNSVWVAAGFGLTSGIEGSVLELDPATNELSRPIPVGNGLRGMAFGFGSIWVTNMNANNLTRIDPDTGELIAEITIGGGPEGIAVGADAVWVANS